MGKLTKNQKLALSKIDPGKTYTLAEATEKVKEITFTKFDASFDIDVRLVGAVEQHNGSRAVTVQSLDEVHGVGDVGAEFHDYRDPDDASHGREDLGVASFELAVGVIFRRA